MKRVDLIKKIGAAAAGVGVEFELLREGGSHSIFRCGGQKVVIPRHREINEYAARGIMSDLDDQIGEDWWK
ncbi:type II toxin-antitoxin system HicA family toxin [Solwaraspora sp. WMMD791]|uniref:type II toxin-antitoxin system HicA family toxin n=1 Tax=Solwaraspora sp. WMMD791 TaxID=3016086 RepID=UPI00249ABFA7|nr:type II toxin-antitoxin system HicA family toxin [Solwaraspora sp. WMMD791]WFE27883.1 type II toxin-antitoxin system HicA family toxin [Solwaraspora sp. WMMD791]